MSNKFIGVYNKGDKWVAQVRLDDGKRVTVGTFTNAVYAASAYDQYVKVHGLERKLNFRTAEECVAPCVPRVSEMRILPIPKLISWD
jgi:hypothetical protein